MQGFWYNNLNFVTSIIYAPGRKSFGSYIVLILQSYLLTYMIGHTSTNRSEEK